MKISMWILADWLKNYNPKIMITEGKMNIQNIRFFSTRDSMKDNYVYVGYAENFISDLHNKVICVNDKDMLILDTEDTEEIFNKISEAFEHFGDWENRINKYILDGDSLLSILESSYNIIEEELVITNVYFKILYQYIKWNNNIITYDILNHQAKSNSEFFPINNTTNLEITKLDIDTFYEMILKNGMLPIDYIKAITNEKNFRSNTSNSVLESYIWDLEYFPFRTICYNLIIRDELIGWLAIPEINNKISNGKMQLVNILGNFIKFWILSNSSHILLKPNIEMFKDLLEDKIDYSVDYIKNLQTIGWESGHEKAVIKVICNDLDDTF